MKNHFKKSIIILLLLIAILSPSTTYASNQAPDIDYFTNVLELVQDKYLEDKPTEEYLEGAMKGIFNSLDEYSKYYTKEEFTKLIENLQGNFVGIGVYIKEEENKITIIEPVKGSPAEKVGLKSGDIIYSVDGKLTKGLSLEEVQDLIKGIPNTRLRLGIQRGDKKINFPLYRQEIKIDPIEYKIINKNIGYIKIIQFNQQSYLSMLKALKHMDNNNITKLVLDLRDNPGGYLDQVIEISKLLIPKGPIVHIEGKGMNKLTYNSNLAKQKYKLSVLINENSASASEILAAAIQDREAGQLVGVTTFGKGTVQELIQLPKGDGLKLTTAQYLSPKGNTINKIGVKPDIEVKDKEQQLKTAISILQ